MGKKFKKIMAVGGSICMVGMTMGMAFAAGGGFPVPFVKDNSADYAIVYGVNAAASDINGANSINTYLDTFYSETTSTDSITSSDFSSASSVTYDEIELGKGITQRILTDNKITSLIDGEISWNDGDGYKNYDVHEEIRLGEGLKIVTTLDTEDLNTSVALENDQSLEYRYVFDKSFDTVNIGNTNTSDLVVNILGKEYTITKVTDDSITVSEAEEKIVVVGESVTIDGIILKIDDIFSNLVEVNGVLIRLNEKKVVNGIEVKVTEIAYHTTSTLPSKAIIKFGKDIERKINDGDEYIEDDENWIWVIDTEDDETGTTFLNSIGVKYDKRNVGFDDDEPEENPITIGQSYVFPENYAAVSFDGLTDVNYEDFELYFDDRDLYTEIGSEKQDDVNVVILEGENDDSIQINGHETSTIYFEYYVPAIGEPGDVDYVPAIGEPGDVDYVPAIGEPGDVAYVPAIVNIYFKDIDGDVDNDNEGRIQLAVDASEIKLIVDDTEMDVSISEYNRLWIGESSNVGSIGIKLGNDGTSFDGLGLDKEDAELDDVIVYSYETEDWNSIGTRDYDVMDHYGTIIQDVENNADNDRVILSIPSEQVFATISIKGQGEVITETTETETNETLEDTTVPQLGGILVKDNELSSFKDKNLIIVGGSCINAEAAKLLGGKACGEEFTLKTGITAGKALIQKFTSIHNAGKVAIVIAGYNAIDTTKAVNAFINEGNLDVSLGIKTVI